MSCCTSFRARDVSARIMIVLGSPSGIMYVKSCKLLIKTATRFVILEILIVPIHITIDGKRW